MTTWVEEEWFDQVCAQEQGGAGRIARVVAQPMERQPHIPDLIQYKPCLLLQIWYGNKKPDGGFHWPYMGLWLGLDGSRVKSHGEWKIQGEKGRNRNKDRAFEKNNVRQTETKMLKSGYASREEKKKLYAAEAEDEMKKMWEKKGTMKLRRCVLPLMLFQWSLLFERGDSSGPKNRNNFLLVTQLNNRTQRNSNGTIHPATIVSDWVPEVHFIVGLFCAVRKNNFALEKDGRCRKAKGYKTKG